jgi:MFS family permease
MINNNKQIWIVLIAQFLVIACLYMTDPYWPLVVRQMNPSMNPAYLQYWSAAVYALPLLVTIITTPLWTHLGSRIGYKKMILRACFVLAVTQLLVGFITHPGLLLGVRLLQGGFAGFTAAAQAWSITMSDAQSHGNIIGRVQAATAVGTIVGPTLGGFIANYFGYNYIFFISAAFCFATTVGLAIFLRETPKNNHIKKTFSITHFTKLSKITKYLLGLICLTQTARWMSSTFFALYVLHWLHGSNLTVGVLYSSIALMIVLSAPWWGRLMDTSAVRSILFKRLLYLTLIIAAMIQIIFAFSNNISMIFIACLALGVCLGALSLLPFSELVHQTDQQNKGSVVGFCSSASKMGNLIGVALGALIQAFSNFTISFVSIGIFYVLIVIFVWAISGAQQKLKFYNRQHLLLGSNN